MSNDMKHHIKVYRNVFIGLLIFTQNILISFYPLAVIIFSTVIFDFLGKKAFTNYGKYLIIQRILMVTFALIFLEIWGINGIVFGYTLSLAVFVFLFYYPDTTRLNPL